MRPARAITESALAPARAVIKPAITEVIDLNSGEIVDTKRLITSHLYQDLIAERGRIVAQMLTNTPRFICSICLVPVYLVSRPEEHIFYFRHRHEDGSCPAQTRSPLTYEEICARKYHGLRESEPHKRVKALLARSLEADPAFAAIAAERTWRSNAQPAEFRRPDVQATHASGRLAFEAQLSTTFLSVVVGRREFYRREGALLVWVFGGFDPAYRRLTTDDLLFSNNSNVFVIDEQTTEVSETTRRFHLRCCYRRPIRQGGALADVWEEAITPFETLVQDRDAQQAYLFDYADEEAKLREAIKVDAAKAVAVQDHCDQQDLYEFWLVHGRGFRHTPENRAVWEQLRVRFAKRGIELPLYPDFDAELGAMLNALYSAREGTPIAWKFAKLVQVAHLLAENHPRQLVAFGFALRQYGRTDQIAVEDSSGRWGERAATIGRRMRRFDAELQPDPTLMPLMRFLFPETATKVDAYAVKAGL